MSVIRPDVPQTVRPATEAVSEPAASTSSRTPSSLTPAAATTPELAARQVSARPRGTLDALAPPTSVAQLQPDSGDRNLGQQLRNLLGNTGAVVFDAANVYMDNSTEGMREVSGFDPVRQANVSIHMHEVEGLPPTIPASELDRAATEKAQDDREHLPALREYNRENGTDYQDLRQWSEGVGYYGSTAHRLWADAAEARTGGRIPASWWLETHPFGGAAGGGPKVLESGIGVVDALFGGEYPGSLSRIGLAHDTDWALGRYFGVGPMSALDGAPIPGGGDEPRVRLNRGMPRVVGDYPLGYVGLFPVADPRYDGIDSYVNGHPDWNVQLYD